jgi:oligoendopeptidase F
LGTQFKKLYLDILKDTGRMTAEDLIQKHLKEDITTSAFWMKPLSLVEKSVKAYKALL